MARKFWARPNPLLGYWRKGCESPTAAEAALEPHIAALGERYRHQYPFWGIPYFADFALLDRKVIIEVDGDSHDRPEQKEKDLEHTLKVLELGWRVVRVTNEQVLRDPAGALQLALRSRLESPDILLEEIQLKGRLELLRQNYPELLDLRAKRSKSKSERSKAAARTRARSKVGRSTKSSSAEAVEGEGVTARRKRLAAARRLESQRP